MPPVNSSKKVVCLSVYTFVFFLLLPNIIHGGKQLGAEKEEEQLAVPDDYPDQYQLCQQLSNDPFVLKKNQVCETVENAPPHSSPTICLFVTGHSWDHYLIFAMNEINSGMYPELQPLLPLPYRIILANVTSPFPEGEVQQKFISNYESCSLFVGPAWTVQASAIGEIASIYKRPLVSGGASGIELSRPNFKYFTRVIPNDVGLLDSFVALIMEYEMQKINIVCVNDEYGRAITEALIRRAEGKFDVELIRCYDTESSNETMAGILEDIELSTTAVTFLSMVSFQTPLFLNLAGARGMHDTHLWLSPHATQVVDKLDPVPTGAWGLAYGEELREDDPLSQRYAAKDTASHHDKLCQGCNDYDELTYWGAYGYDAILTAAYALLPLHNVTHSYSGENVLESIYDVNITGNTGVLNIDENGDRFGARIPLFYLKGDDKEEFGVFDYSGLSVTKPPMWPGGGYEPLNLLRIPPKDLNHITHIRWFGWTLAFLVIGTSLFFMGWIKKEGNNSVVLKSQPLFLFMICVGTLLMGFSIFPLGIDDSISSVEGCNIACMAFPWLFTTGFTFSFSAIFSKIWRINKLFSNPRFKRIRVTEKDVLKPFFLLFSANVIFLLLWTIFDPLVWKRVQVDPINSYGWCRSKGEVGGGKITMLFGTLLTITNGLCLILANYQAYHARNICDEFSESKYMAISMASMFQLLIIGLPLVFLVNENPSAKFFVFSGAVAMVALTLLLLIFVPKILLVKKKKTIKKHNITISGSSFVDTSASRNFNSRQSVQLGIRVTNKALLNEGAIFRLEEKLIAQGIDTKALFNEVGLLSTRPTEVQTDRSERDSEKNPSDQELGDINEVLMEVREQGRVAFENVDKSQSGV